MELAIIVIALGLLTLWVMGVVKLLHKNQTVLGWIAIAGIIDPLVSLIGFAGWFVDEKQS